MNKLIFFFSLTIILGSQLIPKVINPHPVSEEVADLVARLSPAVVNVFTTQDNQKNTQSQNQSPSPFENMPPQFRDFFDNLPPGFPFNNPNRDQNRPGPAPQALGSGFVIDKTGYIVTNQHVISQANEIKVKFQAI